MTSPPPPPRPETRGVPREIRLTSRAPLLVPAVGAAVGALVDRHFWSPQAGVWLTLAAGFAVVLVVARGRAAAALVAFAAIGGLWHHHRWWDVGDGEFGSPPRWPARVLGTVIDDAIHRPSGEWPGHPGLTRTVIELSSRLHNDGWRPAEGRLQIVVLGDRTDLEIGDRVEAMGMLSTIEGPLNPGESNLRDYWRAQGVWARLNVDAPDGVAPAPADAVPPRPELRALGRARRWSRERLAQALDPETLPIASALLLGRREALDPELSDAFAKTGATHLLAISGLHLQAIAFSTWWLLRAFGVGRGRAFVLVGAGSLGYGLLVGLMPSVVRSLAMTVYTCFSGVRSRRIDPVQVFAGAGLATLAFNPAHLFDVGCQLSFLAVGAIVWGVNAVRALFRRPDGEKEDPLTRLVRAAEPRGWILARAMGGRLSQGVLVSASVWFVAWPLVAHRFHVVSPLGVLLNVPLVPMTTVALFAAGASLVLTAVWAPLAAPSAWLAGFALGWTERIVAWGAARTWGHWFTAGPSLAWTSSFYLLILWFWWTWIRRRELRWSAPAVFAVWFVLWSVFDRPRAETRADFLAVGHGLSVALQSEGRFALYDSGRMGDRGVGRRVIAPALWALGARRLDAVFLSHADADHYNGLPDLLDRIPVGVVHVPSSFAADAGPDARALLREIAKRGVPIVPFDAGSTLALGPRARLTALHPPGSDATPSAKDNERSLVLDFEAAGRRVLLTGDLEGTGLARLTEQPPPRPYDVVLAPHHGAKSANPARFHEWAGAKVVVASQRTPTGNPPWLDHPSATSPGTDTDVPDALSAAVGGARLLRTWRRGAVHVVGDGAGLAVTTFKDENLSRPRESWSVHPLNFYAVAAAFGPWRPWLISVAGIALGLGLALLVFVVEWGAGALVAPRRRRIAPELDAAAGETVRATASDGTVLVGTWRAADRADAPTLILLHGLAEDRSNLVERAAAFRALGWNAAVLDGRGFGESDGAAVAFGGHEAEDLSRWIDRLSDRIGPRTDVAVWGRSMGAVIALRTAVDDSRISALILEAPYADLAETLALVLRRRRLPAANLLSRLILGKASRIAKTSLRDPRPIDLAGSIAVPTLILRGAEDRLVPGSEIEALAGAFRVPVDRIEVPGAGHADVFEKGGGGLVGELAAFLARSSGDPSRAGGSSAGPA